MPNDKKIYLTKDGLEKIRKEYDELLKLKRLKAKGESPVLLVSEDVNPEYLAYQEDMNLLGTRLADLAYILRNVIIITPPPKEKQNVAALGATVTVDIGREKNEFTIVGTLEADPTNHKISNESPLGQAILGKKVGDVCKVINGFVNHDCQILKIKYENSNKKIGVKNKEKK